MGVCLFTTTLQSYNSALKRTEIGRNSMDHPLSSTTNTSSQTLVSHSANVDSGAQLEESPQDESAFNQTDLLKAVEIVERDSLAIAQSFTSLFDSLRLALSKSTSSTIDHMECFSTAAGRIQESAIEASTKGNRFVNSCLRLNGEMKGVDALAMQFIIQHLIRLDISQKNVEEECGCLGCGCKQDASDQLTLPP
ncbi:hypothetical protein V2J09_020242 [Rumex salicifolius]